MFERFTKNAREVVKWAMEEARRLGYRIVGPEHFLLGLIRQGSGAAARILKNEGINLASCRTNVEAITGKGSDFPKRPWYKEWLSRPYPNVVEYPLSEETKTTMTLASDFAAKHNSNIIDTEQLLIGF
jgi:ATP-dependent Clp protease ATP-binding subunit ClpC